MSNKCNLILHCGAEKVERAQVTEVITPDATRTWQPVSHESLITRVTRGLDNSGYRIVNEAHALSADHARYFGLFQLEPEQEVSTPDDYSLILGLRNSHDKKFPAALVLGAQVFVCDNLSFNGEIKLARKHTRYIERDLPGVIGWAVGQLAERYAENATRFDAYKHAELADKDAHDIIIRALDNGAVCGSQVTKVLTQYRTPNHPEFVAARGTVWGLYNAFTEVAKENSVFALPRRTQCLHGILDNHVGIGAGLALAN
jgi:hypothetical protein